MIYGENGLFNFERKALRGLDLVFENNSFENVTNLFSQALITVAAQNILLRNVTFTNCLMGTGLSINALGGVIEKFYIKGFKGNDTAYQENALIHLENSKNIQLRDLDILSS